MPYRTVAGARKRVAALKNMSDHQIRVFIRVFNSLIKSGTNEKDAFPQAIGQASKFKKKMQTKTNKQMKIDKMFYKELEDALYSALEDKYCIKIENPYSMDGEQQCSPEVNIEDFDDSFVYYEIEDSYFKESYTYDESKQEATLGDDQVEVVEQTTYVEKKKESTVLDQLKANFEEFLIKCSAHFGGSAVDSKPDVVKSVDKEQRLAMFVVLAPDEFDLHNDIYSAEEVEKACNNYNRHCMVANLFHKVETEKAEVVQSFITPAAFVADNGREVKKGSWVQWWYFPEGDEVSDTLWEGVKKGKVNGVSIQCRATVESLE